MYSTFAYKNKMRGAITLIATIVLMVASSLIIIYAAESYRMMTKSVANSNRNQQAIQAAEAGLDFGMNYFQKNSAAILLNPVNGYIPNYSSSNTSATLANSSSYSIAYTNPIQNNYSIIKITSTGLSDDGSSSRIVSMNISSDSLLAGNVAIPIVTKGNVILSGNVNVTNLSAVHTIDAASTISLNGLSRTTTTSGVSASGSDLHPNQNSLQTMTANDFMANYFGTSLTNAIKGQVAHSYSNNSSTNYGSTLNGMTGTTIWINQSNNSTATIDNSTIGTVASPVLIIVNGNLNMTGTTTIYGFVFASGTLGVNSGGGIFTLVGGVASGGNVNMQGNVNIIYNSAVLTTLKTNLIYWAKVPGSWKDF